MVSKLSAVCCKRVDMCVLGKFRFYLLFRPATRCGRTAPLTICASSIWVFLRACIILLIHDSKIYAVSVKRTAMDEVVHNYTGPRFRSAVDFSFSLLVTACALFTYILTFYNTEVSGACRRRVEFYIIGKFHFRVFLTQPHRVMEHLY